AFSVLGEVYHILTRENYVRTRGPLDAHPHDDVDVLDGALVIFRDSDMEKPSVQSMTAETCSHDALSFNMDDAHPVMQAGRQGQKLPAYTGASWYNPFNGLFDTAEPSVPRMDMGLHKREDIVGSNSTSNFADQIGNTAGCSKTQKIVYMGVAADCTYTSRYGGPSNATTMILNDWNTASSLYKTTFNMSLGIVELAIQDSSCPPASPTPNPAWNVPCSDSVTLNERLSLFSAWRGQRSDGAGLWHLMSGCPTGTEVGVAWLGQVCNTQSSGEPGNIVSGTAVSTAGRTEYVLISFSLILEFTLMVMVGWCLQVASRSARGSVLVGSVNSTCLQDADTAKQTISLQMCGNGIVEAGEDCDPGVGTNSTCCDSKTCKFTRNAVCDPASSACCLDTCQFAPSTQVCRPARDASCDRAEMCTGSSAACPSDQVTDNGTSCGSGSLACANGICTSPDCYGGTCNNGECKSGSAIDTAKAWYTSNLQISIPVTVVVGIVVLLFLWGMLRCFAKCCLCCCGGRRKKQDNLPRQRISSWPEQRAVGNGGGGGGAWNSGQAWQNQAGAAAGGPYPPPGTYQPNHTRASRSWGSPPSAGLQRVGSPDRRRSRGQSAEPSRRESVRSGESNHGQGQGRARLHRPPPAHWVDDTMYNGPNYRG
ncbi:hypothetical protein FRC07_007543, partial [Ceratobasidium sp. 392]